MTDKNIQEGDTVQWNYGAGHPQGTVVGVESTPGKRIGIKTRNKNTVTRVAGKDNPAIEIEMESGTHVVKKGSETTVKTPEGENRSGEHGEETTEEKEAAGEKSEPVAGKKQGPDLPRKRSGATLSQEQSPKAKPETQPGEKGDSSDTQKTDKEPKSKKAKVDSDEEATDKTASISQSNRKRSLRSHSRGGAKTATGGTTAAGTRKSQRNKKDTKAKVTAAARRTVQEKA